MLPWSRNFHMSTQINRTRKKRQVRSIFSSIDLFIANLLSNLICYWLNKQWPRYPYIITGSQPMKKWQRINSPLSIDYYCQLAANQEQRLRHFEIIVYKAHNSRYKNLFYLYILFFILQYICPSFDTAKSKKWSRINQMNTSALQYNVFKFTKWRKKYSLSNNLGNEWKTETFYQYS